MSRSVSYGRGSILKEYFSLEEDDLDFNFDFLIEDLIQQIIDKFSDYELFEEKNRWLGDEDKVLLSGEYFEIGISEYCGLCCLWVVPSKNEEIPEEEKLKHIDLIKDRFSTFGTLRHLGTFSNGEAIFEEKEMKK